MKHVQLTKLKRRASMINNRRSLLCRLSPMDIFTLSKLYQIEETIITLELSEHQLFYACKTQMSSVIIFHLPNEMDARTQHKNVKVIKNWDLFFMEKQNGKNLHSHKTNRKPTALFRDDMADSTSSSEENVTKPYPLDFEVPGTRDTFALRTFPFSAKKLLSMSVVTVFARLPT